VALFKSGLADQGVELGKSVLVLSSLGLFTKLLHIDLSQMQILGVNFLPENTSLIPGFIGIALIYTFVAFFMARTEMVLHTLFDTESQTTLEKITASQSYKIIMKIIFPISVFVYSMPFFVGALSIWLLLEDSIIVLNTLWNLF
jgi:hypothetical protein